MIGDLWLVLETPRVKRFFVKRKDKVESFQELLKHAKEDELEEMLSKELVEDDQAK